MTERRQKVMGELLQAKADWIANVPGAWERYQFWQDEFVRLVADGESASVKPATDT